MIEWIAFDADDTLWHNEGLYLQGLERFRKLVRKYSPEEDIDRRQQEIEIANLQHYGYGVSGFVLSLIEAAIELTGGEVRGQDLQDMIDLSKEMFSAQVELFEHARETVARLAERYPLMLITKGDLRHQQIKVARSGLREYFREIEIVSDKDTETYAQLLERRKIPPENFLMVGDSLRSDILPVLALGGWAVYVPSPSAWAHEQSAAIDPRLGRFAEIEHLGLLPEVLMRWDESVDQEHTQDSFLP